MNRKEFLAKASGIAIALSTVSLTGLFTFPSCNSRPRGTISASDLEPLISEALNRQFKDVMKWAIENGWLSYLHTATNLTIDKFDSVAKIEAITNKTADHLPFTTLIKEMKTPDGFDDFAGSRLIEPGMPQLSLLYHALASPRVRPGDFTPDKYPDVVQLDTLENYIYGLKKFTIPASELGNEYCLAVFAYEYRPAFKTPHHIHADVVYSRTGFARIGEREMNYNRENRCWTNLPRIAPGTTARNVAVTPARYGLFLAKKVKHDTIHLLSTPKFKGPKKGDRDIYDNFEDDKKWFLQPVRKIFNHDLLIKEKNLSFVESHISTKIASVTKDETLIRRSAELIEQDRSRIMAGSSFLVISRCPANPGLIRPVKKGDTQVYLKVEDDNNRYFTSWNQATVEEIEILLRDGPSDLYRIPNGYAFGRNKPMYVNITHKKDKSSKTGYSSLKREANGKFELEINKGEYEAPLFEDSICDGYLSVDTSDWDSKTLQGIGQKKCIPAFSVVTAPDLFPQVDNFDLLDFDIAPGNNSDNESLFYEGGVASLVTCRIPPDPAIIRNEMPDGKNVDDTYTAVYCEKKFEGFDGRKTFNDPRLPKGYFVSGYLPDVSSSVFAPGWDITYAAEDDSKKQKKIFLSTRGLGSPFVEDMKLCAASNGMWPAASPDASRTYQGSVTNKELKDWLRNPTAIPLLDEEIGIHKDSPCTDTARKGSLGWDGEQGPFLQMQYNKWYVNFTDLGRADYVVNALNQRFDASKLRELTSLELITRMDCLKKCIRDATNQFELDAESDLWLISAEKIDWGKQTQFDAHGIPANLKGNDKNWAKSVHDKIDKKESCYLFVFADTIKDVDATQKNKSWVDEKDGFVKRRRQPCKEIYVYQVTVGSLARLM